ncbi:MAG: sulfotransferase [Gammaproteobacteria bacterium]
MEAIFMVGEQRSGSNLLRVILNESPDIAGPHPPHILQRMMPLVPLYGDLKKEKQFKRMVDDVCRLVEHNPVVWEGVEDGFDRDDVRARCRENSLIAIFGAVMDIYAEKKGARAWICKSMQNIRWADQLDAYFDRPKFLYLYRDPRDVALSFSKAVIGDKHPYFVTRQWVELQQLCLDQRAKLGPDQFFSLRYEDLIANPEVVVRDLCGFVGVDFQPTMLEFHRSQEATRTAGSSELWQNVTRPIMGSNSGKFLKGLGEEQTRIVESIAGPIMDTLGYERMFVAPGQEQQFTAEDIARFDAENEQRKAEKAKLTDPEDVRRRQRQAKVIESIRAMAS